MNNNYQTILGSDLERDGMYLELWDRSTTNQLLMEAFYSDIDGSFEYTHYLAVPPEIERWFQEEAHRRLPPALITEVKRFREWASSYPRTGTYGEWECDYENWNSLYQAVLDFVDSCPFENWSEAALQAVLYAIARDNERQHLSKEIRKRHPNLIPDLARSALQIGERDDRWQLAVELGSLGRDAEPLLLEMARDEHEYVRRRALQSLLRINSSSVEELALAAWHQPDDDQEWARMMALHCLYKIGSPKLESLLVEAERDERQYLRSCATRIRNGDVD